ncbi:MAG: FG-GAP repeat domain-containing protein [Promethearchaeota archaeon]
MKKMKIHNLKKIGIIITAIFCILCLNSFFDNSVLFAIENDQIKSSNDDINLTTPENKTYIAPMSGYYPATYGFENDNAGDDPEDWVIETEAAGNIEVIEEHFGHKKVLRIPDTSNTDATVIHQSFNDDVISGTVEFWICTRYSKLFDADIHPTNIQIGDEKAGNVWQHACVIRFGMNGNIAVFNGDDIIDVFPGLLINNWYHVKIEFDCSDDWHLWINGIKTDTNGYNFRGSPSSMTQLRIGSTGSQSPISFIDAIGYSWDLKYDIGDNLHEGLFINYETTSSLVWEAFSLDGSVNKTILGDTTIAMPDFGSHTLQVYGYDSIGTIFESEKTYFEVSPLKLITPENITYTEPMRGNYPGTYSFDNDKNGLDPLDWMDLGGISNVVEQFERHTKVYKLYYPGSGPNQIQAMNMFKSAQNHGTIEFWLAEQFTSSTIETHVDKKGIGQCFGMKISNDKFHFYDGTWHNVGKMAVDREWYHVRIDFETTTGSYMGLSQWTWKLFINNELFGPYNFSITAVPNSLQFYAYFGNIAYVDAIGYSWDPYYNIGDNLHEGLLLDLEHSPYLEWMGYSLDNLPCIPIKGRTTIPLPSYQSHSIQIFGNDSLSHNYQSELRYFAIEYPIELITTNPGTWEDLFGIKLDKYPDGVFIGDANNDGYNDILASTYEIDKIMIMLWNTSSKYWDPPINKSTGDAPLGLFVGDANNDGYNDVVVSNAFGNNISIFLWNESSNNWDPQILKSAGINPSEIIIGDANYDGYNDIITLNSANDISIILWNVSINDWNPQIKRDIGPYPNSLAFGDVNNDGYDDIITSNGGDDHIHMLLWNSTLNDWSHDMRYANNHPMAISVGDANNDGYNDMIAADYEDDKVSIFFWNDTISDWNSQITRYVGEAPRDTFIEDVNNDGYNDIVVLNRVDNDLSIYLWNARYNRWQDEIKKPIGKYSDTLCIGDMNNDGFNDILIGSDLNTDIGIYLWNPAPMITIINPQMNDIFGNEAPNFLINAKDTELCTMWYTIGTEKTIFNENETINQDLWDNLDDGNINIIFYANDTLGSIGSNTVSILKDIKDPEISIYKPSEAQKFGVQAPNYNISILELNLGSMWYTINDGTNKYGIEHSTGVINQTAWEMAAYGNVTITFYAQDLAGNIGYDKVVVEKVKKENGQTTIPGYSLLIIVSIIGLMIFLYLKRKDGN